MEHTFEGSGGGVEHNGGAAWGEGGDEGTCQISAIHVDISLCGVKNASSFVPRSPSRAASGRPPQPYSTPSHPLPHHRCWRRPPGKARAVPVAAAMPLHARLAGRRKVLPYRRRCSWSRTFRQRRALSGGAAPATRWQRCCCLVVGWCGG
jgi:hypothetical protein